MRLHFFLVIFLLTSLTNISTYAQDTYEEQAVASQLFNSDDIIKVVIKTELRKLLNDRRDERDYHDATMSYEEGDDKEAAREHNRRADFSVITNDADLLEVTKSMN